MACAALPAGAGFISSMTNYVDCQAQILGSGAWQALSAPGSTLSIVLAGFLTIFIALIGYNLLLGHGLTVRTGTLAFVKIGAVLALATSWPAYRTLVFDLVTDAPGQLVAEIGPKAAIIGSDGTLLQRLDLTDQALAQLAILGPGNPVPGQIVQAPPPPWAGFNAFALGGSRILFLLTAIAGIGAIRIVTGLMLALGPFFIAFLMFDSTRSLFEGWVKVIAGTVLSAVGVSIVLGLELALMEPWLSNVLARRMAGEPLPAVGTELFVVSTLFAIILIAAIAGCARVARAFRLPALVQLLPVPELVGGGKAEVRDTERRSDTVETERSRAAAIAAGIVAMNRREHGRDLSVASHLPGPGRHAAMAGDPRHEPARPATPVGRTFTRRSGSRVSARANRRDAMV